MFALEFPPIDNLVKWPNYFGDGTFYAFNKIGLISLLAMVIPTVMFLLAKKDMVPSGLQNIVESTVGFVEDQVVMSAIGAEGRKYLPLLLTIFMFVFFGNIVIVECVAAGQVFTGSLTDCFIRRTGNVHDDFCINFSVKRDGNGVKADNLDWVAKINLTAANCKSVFFQCGNDVAGGD